MDATSTPVAGVRDIGPNAVALDIETPPDFDAVPGQFLKITLAIDGEHRSRFYTLSSPGVDDTFEITVAVEPGGEMGPHLAALEPGDEVEITGPFGNAHYDGESSIAVLASGPGIGPAVGLAERVLDEGGKASVVYRDDDPLHEDRLDALRSAGAFVAVLDAETELAPSVTDALAETSDSQVFVYGFIDFLDTATDALAAAGDDPDEAKLENFG